MLELNKIYNKDCLEGLKELDDNSVDLICTDPPYGYNFRGKDWDKGTPKQEIWDECLRVLKAGAFAFVMSAPRQDVQSEMIVKLTRAGFKTKFTPLYWACATGFPKAANIGKLVDKRLGAEREVVGKYKSPEGTCADTPRDNPNPMSLGDRDRQGLADVTSPSTPEAKALDGSYAGFNPKPAVEIILVAMKPLSEKTYVDQALANGKGVTWLDDCRIPYESEDDAEKHQFNMDGAKRGDVLRSENLYGGYEPLQNTQQNQDGRFPANLLVSDDVLNNGNDSKGSHTQELNSKDMNNNVYGKYAQRADIPACNDSGSFSRYFSLDAWAKKNMPCYPFLIVPKASKGEKNEGCNMPIDNSDKYNGKFPSTKVDKLKNVHPTCKPVALMSYLITLGSQEKDLILDPFIGSGTTAIAARTLSRSFIGFELSPEYHKIAEARIKTHLEQKRLWEI